MAQIVSVHYNVFIELLSNKYMFLKFSAFPLPRYHAHLLFDRLSPLNAVEHIQICDSLFR